MKNLMTYVFVLGATMAFAQNNDSDINIVGSDNDVGVLQVGLGNE